MKIWLQLTKKGVSLRLAGKDKQARKNKKKEKKVAYEAQFKVSEQVRSKEKEALRHGARAQRILTETHLQLTKKRLPHRGWAAQNQWKSTRNKGEGGHGGGAHMCCCEK